MDRRIDFIDGKVIDRGEMAVALLSAPDVGERCAVAAGIDKERSGCTWGSGEPCWWHRVQAALIGKA